MDVLDKTTRAIADALKDPKKLPGALILCGIVEAAAALSLVFRDPGGVFLLCMGDRALICVYYGGLVAVVVFGIAEVAVGFWVSGDPRGRRAVGKIIMGCSILPLVIVAGMGGLSFATSK